MKIRLAMIVSALTVITLILGLNVADGSPNVQQSSATPSPIAPNVAVIEVDNVNRLTKLADFELADGVYALEWTPDGQMLLISTVLPNALWEWNAGEFDSAPEQVESMPLNLVHDLQFHPTLPLVLGLQWDKVLLWNMDDHTEQVVWETEGNVQIYGTSFSPNGDLIAIIDTTHAHILDAETFEVLWILDLVNTLGMADFMADYNITFVAHGIVFHPDGQSVFIADTLLDKIYQWDFVTEEHTIIYEGPRPNHDVSIHQLLVDPSNRWLAKSGRGNTFISLWDIQSEQFSTNLQGHLANDGAITGMAFNINSTLIVAGAFDGTIEFWDIASGESLQVLDVSDDAIFQVAISPNGTLLATGSYDGQVTVWGVLE